MFTGIVTAVGTVEAIHHARHRSAFGAALVAVGTAYRVAVVAVSDDHLVAPDEGSDRGHA